MSRGKITNDAADRNKEPIALVLEDVLGEKFGHEEPLNALEVASGSGQHAVYLGKRFPRVRWRPTDLEEEHVSSIKCYVEESGLENVMQPLLVDVSKDISEWPESFQEASFDIILNINMTHIAPWHCTEALFRASAKLLRAKGILVTYGPYAVEGVVAPQSNVDFDAALKRQNPEWGLRDVTDLEKEAKKNGMTFDAMFNMPSNNKVLVWQKSE